MTLEDQFDLVYKTSTTPFFPICLLGSTYSTDFCKIAKIKYHSKETIVLIENGMVHWFFHKDLRSAAQQLFKKIFSSPQYLDQIRQQEKTISQFLLAEIKTPVGDLFDGQKINSQAEKKLKKMFQKIFEYGTYVDDAGFLFQVYLVDDFQKEIFAHTQGNEEKKNRVFNSLLSSHHLTNYEKFVITLYENLDRTSAYGKIAQKYYWLIHDYLGQIIDVNYVQKQVKEMKGEKKLYAKTIREMKERIANIKKEKKDLDTATRKKVEILAEIMYLYNDRKKEVMNQVNIYFRQIFERRFPGISLSQIRKYYQLDPDEVINVLVGRKKYDVNQRDQRWAYRMVDGRFSQAPEKYFSLLEQFSDVKIIKGSSACPGKVKGKVSVILNISHIHLFQSGSILVAPFTNVNYLPVMDKAKAIITDIGGLTSHAAIVAREMKKPCIVGTKIATKVLKDGDLVEVDADKGMVKILKEIL